MILVVLAAAIYLLKLWRDDFLAGKAGQPNPKGLPGTTAAPAAALWIAGIGAVLIVAAETAGELALGVSAEQTDIAAIFLLAMIAAGVLEEVIFRGYLVIQGKGKSALWLGIVAASLVFALLHYQYYTDTPEDGTWRDMTLSMDRKALLSLGFLFLNSLWFYAVRFFKWNPAHSLLPCFVAHIASNVGVFLVKLAQGHVTSLY